MGAIDAQECGSKENQNRRSEKKFKKLLVLTNAHLTDYQPGADMQITRESKYRDVIATLFGISGDEVLKQPYVAGGQSTDGHRHRRHSRLHRRR